jgi:L-iditol 2-dehydrogenase
MKRFWRISKRLFGRAIGNFVEKRQEGIIMTEKMNALVLYGPKNFKVEKVDVPEVDFQEVLCRVKSIAICGTDPHLIAGEYPGFWPPGYPFTPGHEWAGEVVKVGPGVVSLKVGDKVSAESSKGCGFCKRYNTREDERLN